jgi:hypothetical protein
MPPATIWLDSRKREDAMKTKKLETLLIAAAIGLGAPAALTAQGTFDQGQPNQSATGDPGTQVDPELDRAQRQAEEAQQQSEEAAEDRQQETQDPVEDPAYDAFDAQEEDAFDAQEDAFDAQQQDMLDPQEPDAFELEEPDVFDPQDDALPGTDDSPRYDFDSTTTVP